MEMFLAQSLKLADASSGCWCVMYQRRIAHAQQMTTRTASRNIAVALRHRISQPSSIRTKLDYRETGIHREDLIAVVHLSWQASTRADVGIEVDQGNYTTARDIYSTRKLRREDTLLR
jgi:hypothetical protein